MCGRYNWGEITEWDMRRIVHHLDADMNWNRRGDIHPSELAAVVTGKKPGFAAEDMRWGFPSYQSKQLMINARSETALERKSFSDSVMKRRCIIMAKHFYEWDRNKNKVTFTWPESPSIYMAGFYKRYEDGDRFIILTTKANESMSPVHDRMPLILPEDQLEAWIYEDSKVKEFLRRESPMLTREQEFEQLTLF